MCSCSISGTYLLEKSAEMSFSAVRLLKTLRKDAPPGPVDRLQVPSREDPFITQGMGVLNPRPPALASASTAEYPEAVKTASDDPMTSTATGNLLPARLNLHVGLFSQDSAHCAVISASVPTVAYAGDVITPSDEQALIRDIYAVPTSRWVVLRNRRLQMWGGAVSSSGLTDIEPLPRWLESLIDGLVEAGVYPADRRPNHVLINEYQRGQGIMPHTDGPAYFPRTTTLSLGSAAIMRLAKRGEPGTPFAPCSEIVLQPRSIVVFGDEAYSSHLHAISEDVEEVVGASAPCCNLAQANVQPGDVISRDLRVSLTIRHVPGPAAAPA